MLVQNENNCKKRRKRFLFNSFGPQIVSHDLKQFLNETIFKTKNEKQVFIQVTFISVKQSCFVDAHSIFGFYLLRL